MSSTAESTDGARLERARRAVLELEARLAAASRREPIAVVGIGTRFPGGASSPEAYWRLLWEGRDAIAAIPPERWDHARYHDPDPRRPGRTHVRCAGLVEHLREFDAEFFHLSPREAATLDPQQRLLLEVAWEALENAGRTREELRGGATGVFAGLASTEYSHHLRLTEVDENDLYHGTGNAHSVAVGRLSHFLGLRGPCVAVDTACSSALVAVHLACASLAGRECDLALACGVNRLVHPEVMVHLGKLGVLSPSDRCRTFDARADGYVRGEGCGVVVLKRLGDARRDGDRIHAVLLGSAVNHDGPSSGLSVPSADAQAQVIARALESAGVAPAAVAYVEAHGTGTPLGDPIELAGLAQVFAPGRDAAAPLVVGSVKTNIGHLEPAAGIAGLIKAVLAVEHGELPGQLHFERPNPHVPWKDWPVRVASARGPWPAPNAARIAGVSSFGFNGTNAHVVVGEAPSAPARAPAPDAGLGYVLVASARTEGALAELAARYAELCRAEPRTAELCHAAATRRSQLEVRLAVTGASGAELAERLESLRRGERPAGAALARAQEAARVAFVFAGERAVPRALAERLARSVPAFREALQRCGESRGSAELDSFAYSIALAAACAAWGVRPARIVAESGGELAAACVAGALAEAEALALLCAPEAERAARVEALAPRPARIELVAGAGAGRAHAWARRLCARLALGTADPEGAVFRFEPLGGGDPGEPRLVGPAGDEWRGLAPALGALYAHGVAVDWRGVHGGRSNADVALPNHPFERRRHWAERRSAGPAPRAGPAHAFAGRWLASAERAGEDLLELQLETAGTFLAEHRVLGACVFPATGWIELALLAGERLELGKSLDVERLALERLLELPPEGPTTLQLVVERAPDGRHAFRAYARAGGEPGAPARWTRHASGTLVAAREELAADATPPRGRAAEARELPVAEHRAACRARGIEYGPAFAGLAGLWALGDAALGRVVVPEGVASERAAWCWHPALLDACLQTVGVLLADVEGPLLPASIERVRVRAAPAGAELWCRARLDAPPQEGRFRASADVLDPSGVVLLRVEGLELRPPPRAADAAPARDLYAVEWRPQPIAPAMPPERAPTAPEIVSRVAPRVEASRAAPELARYTRGIRRLEDVAVAFIVRALRELGLPLRADEVFEAARLADGLAITPAQRRLFARLLEILAAERHLAPDGAGWRVARAPADTDASVELSALLAEFPEVEAEAALLARTGPRLAGVLRGAEDPLELLVPGGDPRALAHVYEDSPGSRYVSALVADALATWLERRGQRPLRVLEIGAGTGATTRVLLPLLPSERTEYVFTDLSLRFTTEARRKFAGFGGLRLRALDIEKDPAAQGFAFERFDLVVAANVLHATRDLRESLRHARQLLAPGGLLLLSEATAPSYSTELMSGLLEGWWRFGDLDLRPAHALLGVDAWLRILAEEGFVEPDAIRATEGTESRYEAAVLLATAPSARRETWLVLADAGGVGSELCAALEGCGRACVLASRGTAHGSGPGGRRVVARADPDWAARLLADVRAGGGSLQGVVHLWPLDAGADVDAASPVAGDELRELCGDALALARALLAPGAGAPPALVWVTRGAVAAGADDLRAPTQAALWGFGRVLRLEHPELRCRLVDVDSDAAAGAARALCAELLAESQESQVAWRGEERRVARLARLPDARAAAAGTTRRLTLRRRGTLDGLELARVARRAPGAGEVEVAVRAAGLNFADVMDALGLLPFERASLGMEFAGAVVAVGAGVRAPAIGERVVGVAQGSLAEHVTVDRRALARLPAAMTFEEAATLPVAYATARSALALAKIGEGTRVLIHSAAGGVGTAAVRLALASGAEVFATARPDKHERLRALGVRHALSSRTLDFAAVIRERTGGRGVDMVLNSLTGEAIRASLEVVAANGTFVELGKRETWSAAEVARLRPDVAYHVLALAASPGGEQADAEMKALVPLLERGALQPLARTVFPLAQAAEAFRVMQRGDHFGKLVLAPDPGEPAAAFAGFRPDATYLVTGGLGGLGLVTARWMVERGARHLALLGRGPVGAEARAEVQRLERQGARVELPRVDVADAQCLSAVLAELRAGLPPLRGVVHSALVLDDALVVNQDAAHFERVLAPKVDGALNLHRSTRGDALDFFVLYSAGASLIGNRGQANYAAANAFLDALAHLRRARGLPAMSINWGPWAEVGAGARRKLDERMSTRGVGSIVPARAGALLDELFARMPVQVGAVPIDWPEAMRHFQDWTFVADFRGGARADEPRTDGFAARLRDLPARARRAALEERVRERLASVLAIAAPGSIRAQDGFTSLGMDSLTALELRNHLQADLDVSMSPTALFDHPTVDALTEHLGALIAPDVLVPAPRVVRQAPEDLDALVGSVERLSEGEALALLLRPAGAPDEVASR